MATVGEIFLVVGAAWSVLAAIGINRFGDVYARMHAATKTTTLGVLLVLIGAALHLDVAEAVKLLLAGFLLFLTAPIGAHLVGRSVHRNTGAAAMTIDSVDELRGSPPDE
ncbi:monovalent cation/H(+) antiporter subunit G [Actinospongicola halichondriae]|uniref:monovalent cation/H(+) antiporter subunit G n=1 Tax=Actinospongicola halichondriae TaxID=3236844 RepID=UPI003D3B5D34